MPPPADRKTRRMRGFETAGGLLRSRIRAAGESRGFAVARLLTHWAEITGPETARLCQPLRISYGRDGLGATLTVIASGAAAPMVQMNLPRIRERVNACYGYNAIARIRVTQTGAEARFAPGMAEAQTPFTGPNTRPEPTAGQRAAGRDLAKQIQNPELRAALAALGANIVTKSQNGKAPT